MKRVFALTLVFCLLLGLAACAGTPTAAPETGKSRTEAPASAAPGTAAHGVPAEDDGRNGDGPDRSEGERGEGLELPAGLGEFYYAGKDSGGGIAYAGDLGIGEAGRPGGEAAPGEPEPGEPVEPVEPGEPDDPDPGDPIIIDDPALPADPAEALKLTAAEWNDNDNWPFFTNLVKSETISFPSFGLDPRNRIKVNLVDLDKNPVANETVVLKADEEVIWTARTDKNGTTYVFYRDVYPNRLVCGEFEAPVRVEDLPGDEQNPGVQRRTEEITMTVPATAPAQTGLQVLFIVDTTGSMCDEIAYLQMDFSAIAERVGSDGVQWSVSFYRDEEDEYVTRHNPFSSDVAEIQRKINAEYADGGGDIPEAVAQVLTECLTERSDWDESCAKLAFLIFDAPPHEGKEAELRAAVQAAAAKGIHLIPVVASNAERDTELFGRALAILTNGTYVFLTDDSGVGDSHLEPIVGDYEVEKLQDLIVRIIEGYRP